MTQSPSIDPDSGKPQALKEKCSTCIFRPGNLMHLREGRLADVVKHNREVGAVLTCHQTLSYGKHPEIGPAACRGFLDSYPDVTAARFAVYIMGGWHLIDPPDDE